MLWGYFYQDKDSKTQVFLGWKSDSSRIISLNTPSNFPEQQYEKAPS